MQYTTEYEGKKLRLTIDHDGDCESPIGYDKAIKWHLKNKRYNLPWDGEPPRDDPAWLIVPVWGYDHGSLSCKAGERTYPFDDAWDSCLLGYVSLRLADFDNDPHTALLAAQSIVAEYSAWHQGDCWGYILEEEQECATCGHIGWQHSESCWGFIGQERLLEGIPAIFKLLVKEA